MNDLISRRAAIKAVDELPNCYNGYSDTYDKAYIIGVLEELPSAQPTLYGYDIEHLELIANVLRKENLPPERIAEVLTDIGRIVSMVIDEFEETLRKAVERCKI